MHSNISGQEFTGMFVNSCLMRIENEIFVGAWRSEFVLRMTVRFRITHAGQNSCYAWRSEFVLRMSVRIRATQMAAREILHVLIVFKAVSKTNSSRSLIFDGWDFSSGERCWIFWAVPLSLLLANASCQCVTCSEFQSIPTTHNSNLAFLAIFSDVVSAVLDASETQIGLRQMLAWHTVRHFTLTCHRSILLNY